MSVIMGTVKDQDEVLIYEYRTVNLEPFLS